MMAGKGFKRIYNLSGGIKAWKNETAIGPPDLGLGLFSGAETGEQAIIIGFGLEHGLREFYLDMDAKVSSPAAKTLFKKLADIEIIHQEQLVALYNQISGDSIAITEFDQEQVQPAMEGGLSTTEYLELFNPDLEQEQEILSLAISIEAQALDLYERAADQATEETTRKALKQIASEERVHIGLLTKQIDEI